MLGQLTKIALKSALEGEITDHLGDEKHEVSKTTLATITDRVLERMTEWQDRPLDPVYPVILIDAIQSQSATGRS